jgi:enhancing lycopene biosynthesis protein 2
MKKFAVILAGCGVYDGAEVQEAVLTLLAIEKLGASFQCFAPDINQYHVVNHLTGVPSGETRNVLVESARIARGNITPLGELDASGFDALIFPGGFGAAKNLCSWAYEGDSCSINPDVERAVKAMFEAGKPIGAMCIAPVILAKLFHGTNLTTGQDPASQAFIEKTGNKYTSTTHGEVVIDPVRKLFTTPCYMLEASLVQIQEGTENIVREMLNVM